MKADAPPLESLLDRGGADAWGEPVRLSPLVRRVLAPNPGPFTLHGTGTFLVGDAEVAVIDPGPAVPAHVEAVLRAAGGGRVTHILVTHTHLDHSPAARPLAEATGAPVLAFGPHEGGGADAGKDDEGADAAFRPDRRLGDGEAVRGGGWTLEAVHTPGHTSNHLCFRLPEERTLFTGDHVMGWSSTVVSPPDGNMTDYLASLARLRAAGDALYRPTHGPAVRDPGRFVDALRAHRLRRLEEILASLGRGARTVPAIVAENYRGLDPALEGAAGRSVLAGLLHLEREGRATREGAAWRSA